MQLLTRSPTAGDGHGVRPPSAPGPHTGEHRATENLTLGGAVAARGSWKTSPWLRFVSPIVLVIIWQGGSVFGYLPALTVSPPSQVARTGWDLIQSGELHQHLLASLKRVSIGLTLGILIGLTLAVAAGLLKLGERLIDPPMQMVRAVPILGLVPLLIVWFGIHEQPKLLIIILGTSVHIYMNVYGGIRNVDAALVEAGHVLGLSRLGMIGHVVLPAALPQALIGLRMATGSAWLLLVVAEQINAAQGLGHLLDFARQFLRTDIIIVVLVIYALLGLAADFGVRMLERTVLVWRRGYSGE